MLRIFLILLLIVVLIGVVAGLLANRKYHTQMSMVGDLWAEIAAQAEPTDVTFDRAMLAGLPEIAQRYFTHAIAEGTVLSTQAEFTMTGDFFLGEKDNTKHFGMEARQILQAPDAFVWVPKLTAGRVVMSGADSFHDKRGSTQFWMNGILPVVQGVDTNDINRAAAVRPAIETIWTPAGLLPLNGAIWEQTDSDTAAITFSDDPFDVRIELKFAANGAVREIWAMRWSNANPDKVFRMQPFGGLVHAEATFSGFTIPSHIEVGNNFGSGAYFPFFIATLNTVTYR